MLRAPNCQKHSLCLHKRTPSSTHDPLWSLLLLPVLRSPVSSLQNAHRLYCACLNTPFLHVPSVHDLTSRCPAVRNNPLDDDPEPRRPA